MSAPAATVSAPAPSGLDLSAAALLLTQGANSFGPYPATVTANSDGSSTLTVSFSVLPASLSADDVLVQPGTLDNQGNFTPVGPPITDSSLAAQMVAAAAMLDVAWTVGAPQTDVSNPGSNVLPANSDGDVHVKVGDVSNADGTPADPSGGPVAFAITQGTPSPADFQPGDWLRVTTPAAAAGLYARLAVSVSAGTALPTGEYRVYVQIGGTVTLRCPGYLAVRN